MRISIVGCGYVGLVSGACFASKGHEVLCIDIDQKKIDKLLQGKAPFYEPGLEEMILEQSSRKKLKFSNSMKEAVAHAEILFICVPTPSLPDGSADLSFVEAVAREIAGVIQNYLIIVDKSTVPVETGEWVKKTIQRDVGSEKKYDVVSNPEFLREGSALHDALHPDRIVVGAESEKAKKMMRDFYLDYECPLILTDIRSAELIKHASNSFLALKISYANALANICEATGANVEEVTRGMGLDPRIGENFLNAGLGYGGSCFPKDIAAFLHLSEQYGYPFQMLKEVANINKNQRKQIIKKAKDALWILKNKKIALLGLSFKPNTDDIRNAPSLDIIQALCSEGAKVSAYDPKAIERVREQFPDISYTNDPYESLENADACIIITEWDAIKSLDLQKVKSLMATPIIIDGRNLFSPSEMKKLGFNYSSVGRPNATEK